RRHEGTKARRECRPAAGGRTSARKGRGGFSWGGFYCQRAAADSGSATRGSEGGWKARRTSLYISGRAARMEPYAGRALLGKWVFDSARRENILKNPDFGILARCAHDAANAQRA